jgi:hypothetical protein
MFLVVIGVITLVVAFAINTPSLQFSRFSRPLKFVGFIIILLGFDGCDALIRHPSA